jgi:hypothetical protein
MQSQLEAKHDASRDREARLQAEVAQVRSAGQQREAALLAELDQARAAAEAATELTPLHEVTADDAPAGRTGALEDRTLLAPEVRRERMVVMTLFFLAIAAGLALFVGGFTNLLH